MVKKLYLQYSCTEPKHGLEQKHLEVDWTQRKTRRYSIRNGTCRVKLKRNAIGQKNQENSMVEEMTDLPYEVKTKNEKIG